MYGRSIRMLHPKGARAEDPPQTVQTYLLDRGWLCLRTNGLPKNITDMFFSPHPEMAERSC